MANFALYCLYFDGLYSNYFILCQGIAQAIEAAKEVDGWSNSVIISFVAVVSTFLLYRLAMHHHKQMLSEQDETNQRLINDLNKCREENKELKTK